VTGELPLITSNMESNDVPVLLPVEEPLQVSSITYDPLVTDPTSSEMVSTDAELRIQPEIVPVPIEQPVYTESFENVEN
jgi:hypothetical protein